MVKRRSRRRRRRTRQRKRRNGRRTRRRRRRRGGRPNDGRFERAGKLLRSATANLRARRLADGRSQRHVPLWNDPRRDRIRRAAWASTRRKKTRDTTARPVAIGQRRIPREQTRRAAEGSKRRHVLLSQYGAQLVPRGSLAAQPLKTPASPAARKPAAARANAPHPVWRSLPPLTPGTRARAATPPGPTRAQVSRPSSARRRAAGTPAISKSPGTTSKDSRARPK